MGAEPPALIGSWRCWGRLATPGVAAVAVAVAVVALAARTRVTVPAAVLLPAVLTLGGPGRVGLAWVRVGSGVPVVVRVLAGLLCAIPAGARVAGRGRLRFGRVGPGRRAERLGFLGQCRFPPVAGAVRPARRTVGAA